MWTWTSFLVTVISIHWPDPTVDRFNELVTNSLVQWNSSLILQLPRVRYSIFCTLIFKSTLCISASKIYLGCAIQHGLGSKMDLDRSKRQKSLKVQSTDPVEYQSHLPSLLVLLFLFTRFISITSKNVQNLNTAIKKQVFIAFQHAGACCLLYIQFRAELGSNCSK